MAYCSRCGVDVEERAETCPLCAAPIQRLDGAEPEPPRYPEVPALPGRQVRYLVWMVFTASLASVALAFAALDVVMNRSFTWSRYPLTGAGVLWLFVTLVVIFARRPIFVVAGQAVATAGFLVLIDMFDGSLDWFVPLALPVVAVVTGGCVLVWLVARLSRRAPALIAASVLGACAAGSVGIDLLVSGHLDGARMSWSFIVLGACVPPTAFLLYFHFRLRKRIELAALLHR